MTLNDGHFKLDKRPDEGYDYLPINRFFTSLAEGYKEFSIGVLLSGADGDGTLGMTSIKMNGGLTFAQNESARFQSMPRGAIAEGAVDLVLSAQEIGQELVALSRQKEAYYKALQDLNGENISNRDEDLLAILQVV